MDQAFHLQLFKTVAVRSTNSVMDAGSKGWRQAGRVPSSLAVSTKTLVVQATQVTEANARSLGKPWGEFNGWFQSHPDKPSDASGGLFLGAPSKLG